MRLGARLIHLTMGKEYDVLCALIRRALWRGADADEAEKQRFEAELDSARKGEFEAKQNMERKRGFKTEADPEPERHVELDADGWERLMRLAARQGVLAVAYDGLPVRYAERGLTKEQWIRWALSVKQIEANHKRRQSALLNLSGILGQNNTPLLLLKGLGLSEDYPRPAHRECGDLDIYLGDDYEKANRLAEAKNIAVNREGPKHSCFYWEGVPVENHLHFLNVHGTRTDRRLEPRLLQILNEQGTDVIHVNGIPVRIPTPDFNALFLTRHAIVHFVASGMVLRNFCDLAMFFTRHFRRVDFELLRQTLIGENQFDVFCSFMEIARRRLGMSPVPGLWTEHNEEITRKIWKDTLSAPFLPPREEYVRMPVLQRKATVGIRLLRSKWKYDLMGSGAFGESVLKSVKALF